MLTRRALICIFGYTFLMMIQNKPSPAAITSLLVALAALGVAAQETNSIPPDTGGCNLFNPVPENLMRELNSDRPDKTESPFTVDAGHYQLEMDFANYADNRSGDSTTKAWNVAPFNLRIGLLNQVEANLIFDSYLQVRTDDHVARTSTTQSGVGDFTTRLKINLWGDDGGQTAFALLPFVKFPTSTDNLGNNAVEGGIVFPLAVKLPHDFDLGLETAFGCLRDANDNNCHADFINSITLDHAIIGKLSGYLEFFVTENIQLDCGCNFGVTRAADNFNPFAGITVRF